MIELFDKETFEAALPKYKGTDNPAWSCVGLVQGEYCYLIDLGDRIPKIFVRSSVDVTGWSRGTGEDSIRAYVVGVGHSICKTFIKKNGYCETCGKFVSEFEYVPLSGKANRWTTRMPGWQDRMMTIVRFLAEMAVKIVDCPKCGELLRLNKVKKAGANKGRWFLACQKKNCFFEWMHKKDSDD